MSEVKIQKQFGVKGAYAYQVIDDGTGNVITDVPEQSNLILDQWLDYDKIIPATTPRVCIGAGVVTPPTVSDVDLGNQIKDAWPDGQPSRSVHEVTPEGTIFKLAYTTNFTGFSGEQVSEIGLRVGIGGPLVTRALIKDGSGNPAAVTVNAGQTLRVIYSIYIFLPNVAATGTAVTPHGSFSWSYERITLPDNNTIIGGNWANYLGVQYGGTGNSNLYYGASGSASSSTNQRIPDIPARKVTRSFYFPATSSARVIGKSDAKQTFLTESGFSIYSLSVVGNRITLPANYDFAITYEVTWGRLP